MSCGDWEEQIALHAGGDLTVEEAAALERHLAGCAQCRETAAAYGWGLNLLRETHREPVPEAHFAAVRARVLAELGRERRSVWRRPWAWVLAAAAVAALVLMAIVPGERQPARPVATVQPPPPAVAPAPPAVAAGRASGPHVARLRRPARSAPVARAPETEPPAEALMVKLYTDDPDVVIYWIADRKGE